jgi:hypothetical protein
MGELKSGAKVACPKGWQVSVGRLSVRVGVAWMVELVAAVQGVGPRSGSGVGTGVGVVGVGVAGC